jgi:hypothetical protein
MQGGSARACAYVVATSAGARSRQRHVTDNEAAIRRCRRCGFIEFGREPRARKSAGGYPATCPVRTRIRCSSMLIVRLDA